MRSGRDFTLDLVRVDLSGGELRPLRHGDGDHDVPAVSPDGRLIACTFIEWGEVDRPGRQRLLLVDAGSGESREPAPDWEAWVHAVAWAPDGSALYVAADEHGHTPVYRVELDGRRTRLCAEGAFSHLCPSPDGATLYALRAHPDAPPAPVALDTRRADQEPRRLLGPAPAPDFASRLEELDVAGPDGATVHAWLVLPEAASAATPVPLAMLVHGGPFSSWSGWQWRWNAQLFAARGYAVLMPDPRLSTGYGHAHIAAAWNDWATLPFADLMACVDAACARPDVDAERSAALGGSYGGYMANWIAGHTDRFRAVVSHASVWAMDQLHGTTDYGPFMEREFGSPYTEFETWMAQSPQRSAERIRTPMLIVHGERDRRVPPDQATRLWTDLKLQGVDARMLWFPDENHWVLKPQNARLWYETVLGFLDEHLSGQPRQRPALL
jgi:dipeptidyl aminopeptidase/acylaminoacyl peptidase